MKYELKRKYCRNDIFWNALMLIETDKGYEYFKYHHWGYNDRNYWENVIPAMDKTVTIVGDKGTEKKFFVDLVSNLISEVKYMTDERDYERDDDCRSDCPFYDRSVGTCTRECQW